MLVPCLVSGHFKSFLVILDKIIEDIPRHWNLKPARALPGFETVSISLGWKEIPDWWRKGKDDLLANFKAFIDLGAVIAIPAGNRANPSNDGDYEGYETSRSLRLLGVTTLPSLIRVDLWEIQSDGTSGVAATATSNDDVDYRMSLPGNPFRFGNDNSQFQQKVKDFYTVGYKRRVPSAHPRGAYYRPGRYANVVWNEQDGRSSTVCPLSVNPGAIKKRDRSNPLANSELEPADICANYTASSSATSRMSSTAYAVTFASSSTLTTTPSSPSASLACTQYFYYPVDGAINFVCHCNDGISHRPPVRLVHQGHIWTQPRKS
ncbi:MAG: hypothetical protein Q9175_003368 [Cornicularia normoerica]